jgi:hypothetical protein
LFGKGKSGKKHADPIFRSASKSLIFKERKDAHGKRVRTRGRSRSGSVQKY